MSTRKPARPNLAEAKKLIAQMRPRAAVTQPRHLDLRPDCLLAPDEHDVAVVRTWMLWPRPEDEALRRDARQTQKTQLALETGDYPAPTTEAENRLLYNLMRNSPRMGQYAEAIKAGFKGGMIAGSIILETVGWSSFYPGRVTLGPIKESLARRFSDKSKNLDAHTIENSILKDYRCVAVYWAAYRAMAAGPDEPRLPCAPEGLGIFLAIADEFRRSAEATRTYKAPRPLLRPGETVLIPPEIQLPRGRLRFERPARR